MFDPDMPHAARAVMRPPGAAAARSWRHHVPAQSPTSTVLLVSLTMVNVEALIGSVGSGAPQPSAACTTTPTTRVPPINPPTPIPMTFATRPTPRRCNSRPGTRIVCRTPAPCHDAMPDTAAYPCHLAAVGHNPKHQHIGIPLAASLARCRAVGGSASGHQRRDGRFRGSNQVIAGRPRAP